MEFKDIKTKKDLEPFLNVGEFEYDGLTIELKTTTCAGSDDFLKIIVAPITPQHQPLYLGNKWLEYTEDSEIAELIPALAEYKAQAFKFVADVNARSVVRYKTIAGTQLLNLDSTDRLKRNRTATKVYLDGKPENGFMIRGSWGGHRISIDGKEYTPIWSYWLDGVIYKE